MIAALWVALGGALGSVARYELSLASLSYSRLFPWGTLGINIVGSFLLAFFAVATVAHTIGRLPANENLRLFFMVGLCGGFTTFSTFSLQSFELLRSGAFIRAFANMALSVLLCLAACAAGAFFAEKWTEKRAASVQAQAENVENIHITLQRSAENSETEHQ